MTDKLAQLLNLPPVPEEPTVEQAQTFVEQNREIMQEVDSAITKIDAALPMVRDLEASDAEMDEIAELAKTHAQDLMDLGLNIDPRFAGVIMQTAGTMLGHAITAKTAKMDKKLRMISLQLQKARLDHQINKDAKKGEADAPIEGEGMILDRNDLLKQILAQSKSEKK